MTITGSIIIAITSLICFGLGVCYGLSGAGSYGYSSRSGCVNCDRSFSRAVVDKWE